MRDEAIPVLTISGPVPTVSTLIEQQMTVVSTLQGYAAYGENGPDASRQYGTALSTAIDKLATLEGLRHDKALWRLRQEHEDATS